VIPRYETTEELLAAIDALGPTPPGAWAATDADGTLWHTDLADLAWHRALREGAMRPAAAPAMRRKLEAAGLQPSGEVHRDAELLYDAYKRNVVDDWPLLDAMMTCYAGWTEAELRAWASRLAREEVALRAFDTTAAVLQGLRARGHRVAVVSGSPRLLVEEALAALGLEVDLVVGVDATREADRIGDRLRPPVTWARGKVEALQLQDVAPRLAFGDTHGDLALLESAAALAVLVHPRPSLHAHASLHPGRWAHFAPRRTAGGDEVHPPVIDRVIV
jgi:phosphoserine phosphatase